MDYTTTTYSTDTSSLTSGDLAGLGFYMVFVLVLVVAMIVAMWRIFQKAGKPGWAALVPIYNSYVLLEIVGRPGWWLLLMFIPFANFVVTVIVALDLAKAFGKSQTFGIVGLILFSFVGYLILGFGKDQYLGATAGSIVPPAGPASPPSAPPAATPPTPPAA